MKLLVLISCSVLLTACATKRVPEPVIVTEEILVPVLSCPAADHVKLRPEPTLPVSTITDTSDPGEVASSYINSIIILKEELVWYRTVIEGIISIPPDSK